MSPAPHFISRRVEYSHDHAEDRCKLGIKRITVAQGLSRISGFTRLVKCAELSQVHFWELSSRSCLTLRGTSEDKVFGNHGLTCTMNKQKKKPCDNLLPIFRLQTYLKVTAVCSNCDSNSGMVMLFAPSKTRFSAVTEKHNEYPLQRHIEN